MEKSSIKNVFCIALCAFCSALAWGQDSSKVKLSGFIDVYYAYDSDAPTNHERDFFVYNHKRHNEVNINLAYLKAAYSAAKLRGNLALMTGNYAQYNLAGEPSALRHIYEANIGVELSRKHRIWLDAGIMPSHIGFESAVSADCWTPSRSIVAESSPYYETGIKLTATNKKENFFASILYLNGWQRIQRPDGFNRPSFGVQLNYKPKSNLTLNYSNFIGSDKPDSLFRKARTYHNFYGIYEPNSKWGITAGFDIGTDNNANYAYRAWYSPVLILRYSIKNWKIAARGEYFNDKNRVLFSDAVYPFNLSSVSLNADYAISENCLFRIEGKNFHSEDHLFKNNSSKTKFVFMTTLNLKF